MIDLAVPPAPSLPPRDTLETMTDRVHQLIAETAQLERAVAEYKRREALYVRCISEMLHAPTVVAVLTVDGQPESYTSFGTVSRRVVKMVDTPSEYGYREAWVPRPAVPGTRAALAQQLDDALDGAA